MSWEVVRSQELHHGTDTGSIPQSHNIIRAHFTDEESEARELVQVTRGHRVSQWRGRTGIQASIPSSLFYPYAQAKLPTLQLSGYIPYISLQMEP